MASTQKPLCVLSLDGGGVRGLSELIVVEKLMIKVQEQRRAESIPKPCDVFDLICGTSTGGIIALMLGRLRMSVQEVKNQYCVITEKVFGHPKKGFGKGRDQFSAAELENVMREIIFNYSGRNHLDKTGDPELKLLEGSQDTVGCKVFVCTRNARAMQTVRLFRSYKTYEVGTYEEEMKVWQAGRATSAAPTFFKRLKIGHENAQEEFLDGGLGSNNPTKILLEEMVRIYGDRGVSCIVSIGAGKTNVTEYTEPGFFGKLMPTELITALKKMATDCEQTEVDVSKKFLKRPGVYFRFNVEHGLEGVGMEEWNELGNITSKTHEYLLDHKLDLVIKEAVSQLHTPTAKLKASDLSSSLPNTSRLSIPSSKPSCIIHDQQMDVVKELEECYESLGFAQIDTRKEHVNPAFSTTYQWLLGLDKRHPRNHTSPFLHWLSNHVDDSNVFWLSGKAGSGKSTLMKFLHDRPAFKGLLAQWMASKELSRLVVADFYFYERGESILQKSREGLLRALLYNLLFQVPTLKHMVLGPKVKSSSSRQASGNMTRAMYMWSWADLKNALLKFMHNKPSDMGVYLFADGLDEYLSPEALKQDIKCDDGDNGDDDDDDDEGQFTSAKSKGHREIADFLLQLARDPKTKICVSSRPLPIFENRFGGFPYLKLEDLTSRDIQLYVSEKLRQANKSNGLTAEELNDIVSKTVRASSGVFLWVELVVEQLASRLINGDRAKELEQWLLRTPKKLAGAKGLYMQMLQDIAPADRQQGQHFFEAVRCARHQLSPFIISFSEDTREEVLQTPVRVLADQELRMRLLQIQSRLKSRCAGLLELQKRPLGRGEREESGYPRLGGIPFSDQLRREPPLFVHNTTVVNYYHQTVKEFLQSRAVQRILSESVSIDYATLIQACIQRVKCLSYELSVHRGTVELWAHLKDALFYAERAEIATGKADTELLDHLDKVAEESFRTTLQSPCGSNGMKRMKRQTEGFLSGKYHWTILEVQVRNGKPFGWCDNFLSWAVQANLCRYLEAKMSAADYRRKPGRPLLAYAVAPRPLTTMQQYRASYNDMFGITISSPATVKVLLEHGEFPNEKYHGRTIWEYMWYSLLEYRHQYSNQMFPDMSVVLEIMRLMIEAGADPNARVMYRDGSQRERHERTWHRHSCLFAILVELEGPQNAKVGVAEALAQRGAHFYIGEKESIEKKQNSQAWVTNRQTSDSTIGTTSQNAFNARYFETLSECPLESRHRPWPEREGPSDAQWEIWGDEIEAAERQMEDPDDFMHSAK